MAVIESATFSMGRQSAGGNTKPPCDSCFCEIHAVFRQRTTMTLELCEIRYSANNGVSSVDGLAIASRKLIKSAWPLVQSRTNSESYALLMSLRAASTSV